MKSGEGLALGIDIGGTFTDVVLMGDGHHRIMKTLSTPEDYSIGVVRGVQALLAEAAVTPGAIQRVVHATTIASNAVLEGTGARTALMTTRGFRDVLEMRRLRIPVLYDLQYVLPAPLARRRDRFEINERLSPDGQVWEDLDEADVLGVAEEIVSRGYEALAIAFLHSYANPAHELRAAELVRQVAGDELFITCSAAILPEPREYERTSTAVVNAYLGPVVHTYLRALEGRLRDVGLTAPLQIMQSGGGVMSSTAAASRPAHLVESGPAAGVVATAHLAKATGIANLISLDMGGTTAKAGMLEKGEPVRTTEYEVGAGINLSSRLIKGGGHAIRLPFIDLSEIGAGGGSIVRVDVDGLLRVGPESAGSDPGPVSYGLGGEEPTLTDALVILGYLNPEYLAGGTLRLASERAYEVVRERIAEPLGVDVVSAAYGVFEVAVATMTRAVKAVSTFRGRDPRDFVLCAFGGNGPVTAAAIARTLQMQRVLIPPSPGVFSAAGLLLSELEYEFGRTLFLRGDSAAPNELESAYGRLEQEALTAMAHEGYSSASVALLRRADVRYTGQAYELTIPLPDGAPNTQRIALDFHDEHLKTYGHASLDDPVDIVTIKVVARIQSGRDGGGGLGGNGGSGGNGSQRAGDTSDLRQRSAYFGKEFGHLSVPVLDRASLAAGTRQGPLVVEEYDATCVVPPHCTVTVDDMANIDIALGDRHAP